MSSPLQRIKKLIPSLPKDDIPYAEKFLKERNYEALMELTLSSYQRLEKASKREKLPEKYVGVDIELVQQLAIECSDYYYLLYPEDLVDDCDECDEGNDEEDY